MNRLQLAGWRVAEAIGLTSERVGRYRHPDLFAELAEMRRDNAAAPTHFSAGPIWQGIGKLFTRWFAAGGIGDIEDHPMNGLFSSPPPGNPKLLRYACWMLYRSIRARDTQGLLNKVRATTDPNGPLTFVFDGTAHSWDTLISIDALYAMAEIDPRILTDEVVVAEIGAGWGRIGYALRLANPKARYVVFDLPEVLVVSSRHLPRRLPDDAVSAYRHNRTGDITRDSLTADLTFLAPQDLGRVADGTFDFAINIASFQEMGADQVAAYCAEIDRTTAGVFYTQQLWNAATHGYGLGEVEGWAQYRWPAAWTPTLKRNAAWSDLYFEAAFRVGHGLGQTVVDERRANAVRERDHAG